MTVPTLRLIEAVLILVMLVVVSGCSSAPLPAAPETHPIPIVNPADPASVLAASIATMRQGPARVEEETRQTDVDYPTMAVFSQDGRGRMRWEATATETIYGRTMKQLCVNDGDTLWVYNLDHHGRRFVSSASLEAVAQANSARRPSPPAGDFGRLDPASELEGWASVFQIDHAATEDVEGEPCYVLTGSAGPWFKTGNTDPVMAAAQPYLREAASIRITIACEDLWMHKLEVLKPDGTPLVWTRYHSVDLHPRFASDTFQFDRPSGAKDAPFFPEERR